MPTEIRIRALDPGRPGRSSLILGAGYAMAYLAQTWPLARRFWSHAWLDGGDGLVMVWNLWLARQQPLEFWYTHYLFAPRGVSLLGHTYVPLKGWLGALLPLPLYPTLNLLVLASFALAGVFTFWLAYRFSRSIYGSVVAGYAFTFTGFHWAHAQGHLNLLSTELLPLYALVWLRFEDLPSWRRAVAPALVLLAVVFTDYYFAVYCCLLTVLFIVGKRMPWSAVGKFLALAAPTTGLFAVVALIAMARQHLLGAHDAAENPLDPVSLLVPGGHWRFAALTQPIWERFGGDINETSVQLGLGLWIAILWKARCRRWWAALLFFLVLALGERLTVLRHVLPIPMPYQLLEILFPPLGFGGMPSRMVVMVALSASVLGSMAFARLGRRSIPLLLLLVVELLPSTRPTTRVEMPGWVEVLAVAEDPGPLLDVYSNPKRAMFYQTRHGHPISGGALARVPAAAVAQNQRLYELHEAARPDLLFAEGYRFILIEGYTVGGAQLLWDDGNTRLYHLGPAGSIR